jgi:uncharacterized protein YjiS (DUF1127 family)
MTTLDTHVGARMPRAASLATGPAGYLRRWIAERRIYAELSARSDRELEDIGVMRGDLREVARRAARGVRG